MIINKNNESHLQGGMPAYIYIHIYVYMCVYIYIIYLEGAEPVREVRLEELVREGGHDAAFDLTTTRKKRSRKVGP